MNGNDNLSRTPTYNYALPGPRCDVARRNQWQANHPTFLHILLKFHCTKSKPILKTKKKKKNCTKTKHKTSNTKRQSVRRYNNYNVLSKCTKIIWMFVASVLNFAHNICSVATIIIFYHRWSWTCDVLVNVEIQYYFSFSSSISLYFFHFFIAILLQRISTFCKVKKRRKKKQLKHVAICIVMLSFIRFKIMIMSL